VEQWDDADIHFEELIALTGDYRVAGAAHEAAVKGRPGRIVTLRRGWIDQKYCNPQTKETNRSSLALGDLILPVQSVINRAFGLINRILFVRP
jgi:hypothetical protein